MTDLIFSLSLAFCQSLQSVLCISCTVARLVLKEDGVVGMIYSTESAVREQEHFGFVVNWCPHFLSLSLSILHSFLSCEKGSRMIHTSNDII